MAKYLDLQCPLLEFEGYKLNSLIYTQHFNTIMHIIIKFQVNFKCAFVLYYVVIADCAKLIALDDPVPH